MLTIAADQTALHGVQLPAGVEVLITFAGAPRAVTVVVTGPGTEPIYWNAADEVAAEASTECRIIPAGVVAIDDDSTRRVFGPDGSVSSVVHLFSAAAATVSVQRGR